MGRRSAVADSSPIETVAKTGERFLAIDEPGFTTWLAVGHPMPALAPSDEARLPSWLRS